MRCFPLYFNVPANIIPTCPPSNSQLETGSLTSLSVSLSVASSLRSAADHSGQWVSAAPLEGELRWSPWLLGHMGARSEPALHPVSTTQPALHHPQPCALQSPRLRLSGVPDGPWRGTLLHCLNGLRWDAWQGNMGIMGYLISWNCCIKFFLKTNIT